jgi:pimeloyl-ACP methyl ester carboxylesterase
MAGLTDGAIEAGDRTVAWRVVGEGPPLVLLNGYSGTAADWDPGFLGALGARHSVVCPDHRGMGESTLGDASLPITIDSMVDDVERVLDALELEAVPLAGWSMGGFVAQRLTVRVPERVHALVLVGTDPGGPDAVRAETDRWSALTDHSGTPREQASRLIPLLFPPVLAPQVDQLFGDLIAEARARLDHDAVHGQELAMQQWHHTEQPRPPVVPPTLILHGTEDVVIPFANAERLAAVWTGAPVVAFEGAGHACMAQDSTGAAAAIVDFLAGA